MTDFEVREARTPAEVEAAGRVTVEANAEFAPPVDVPDWLDYVRSQADAAARATSGTLLVAVDDAPPGSGRLTADSARLRPLAADATGDVVGTVTLYLHAGTGGNQWRPDDPIFRFLAVAPAARGRGIGRALLDECLRRARAAGKRRMALHTTVAQAVARGMYERAGFVREPEGDLHLDHVTIIAYAREL